MSRARSETFTQPKLTTLINNMRAKGKGWADIARMAEYKGFETKNYTSYSATHIRQIFDKYGTTKRRTTNRTVRNLTRR